MSFLRRLGRLFSNEARAAVDRLDNPARSVEDAYQEALEIMGEARERLAEVLTAKKKLEMQASTVERTRDRYMQEAQYALSIPDEARARRALARANAYDVQLADLRAEIAQIGESFLNVERSVEILRARTEAIRHQKEITAARVSAAKASLTASTTLGTLDPRAIEIDAMLRDARERTETLTARASAVAELVERGTLDRPGAAEAAADVEARLREAASDAAIEAQLAEMKRDMLPPPMSS